MIKQGNRDCFCCFVPLFSLLSRIVIYRKKPITSVLDTKVLASNYDLMLLQQGLLILYVIESLHEIEGSQSFVKE